MLIYLAHPIDQVIGRAPNEIRRLLATTVASLVEAGWRQGHWLYRPSGAFGAPGTPDSSSVMAAVDRINRVAIFESDAMIAVLMPDVPTLGVPSEIEEALILNRPVCIVTTEALQASSVQMASWASRGAQIRLVPSSGAITFNIAEALDSLPDPLRLEPIRLPNAATPPLLIQRHSTNAKVPGRAYQGDAGLDLAIVGEHTIHPGEYKLLPTGIHAAVPDGYWGFMTARSSTWANWRFDIRTAVIDSGYRGELMVGVHNRGSERKTIMPGTRLAQYVLLPAFMGAIHEVDELPKHERGENGYGSSGE